MVATPASDSGAPSLPSCHPAEEHVRAAQQGAEDASGLQTGCFLGMRPALRRLEGTSENRAGHQSRGSLGRQSTSIAAMGIMDTMYLGLGGPGWGGPGVEGQHRLRLAGWSHGSGSSKLT